MSMENSKDCLMCSNSYSYDDENGNQCLYCIIHQSEVADNEYCEDFN